jgi:hypothetical protein
LRDRLMGAGGIVFFGACAAVPMVVVQRHWPRFTPHLPLVAALAQIPWVIGFLVLTLFIVGDAPVSFTRDQERAGDALAVLPAFFGLLWAAIAVIRLAPRSVLGALSLALGGLICGGIVLWYSRELFN